MNLIKKYLEYLKIERKYSDKTIMSYYSDLNEYYCFLNQLHQKITNINYDVVEQYLRYLYKKDINKNSLARKLSSIRGFYNYLVRENMVEANYFKDISNPKKELYLPKFLKREESNKIFSICEEDSPLNQRNTLIIELLYATGLRVSELVNIRINDIDQNDRTIKILGKGSKERLVIYNNHTQRALELYLKDGYVFLNKLNSSYLILNKDGNKLSERYVRNIVDKMVHNARLDIKISPHTLRHTFATDMLENGADLMTVKELLGHESLNTTSIYTHVTNEQIKKVYKETHPKKKKK